MIKMACAVLVIVLCGLQAQGAEFKNENLDNYANKAAVAAEGIWSGSEDGRISLETGAVCRGGSGKCFKIDWNTGGTIALSLPTGNISQVHVRFYYKNVKTGGSAASVSKVLKLFGVRNNDSYSNFTIAQGYQNVTRLSIGDGTGLSNDSTCVIRYGSNVDGCLGRGVVSVYTPAYLSGLPIQDGQWHCIEVMAKYNTNTGTISNSDGAFSLWLDGKPVYSVTGIIMRNPANSTFFDHISFLDHAQDYLGYVEYLDDIVISDSYIGPISSSNAIRDLAVTSVEK